MRPLQILSTILLLTLGTIIFFRYRKLALPKSNNKIDSLALVLHDMAAQLPPQSTIGFNTNIPQDERTALYFKLALVMAPAVLKMGESDTMLLVESRAQPAIAGSGFQSLADTADQSLVYRLVKLNR